MTTAEQIELAIYRFIESVGKGQARTVDLSRLTALVVDAGDVDVIDALRRLFDDGLVVLDKYVGRDSTHVSYSESPESPFTTANFFYRESFRVKVTPKGRLDFERRQMEVDAQRNPVPPKQKKVRQSGDFRTAFSVYTDSGTVGEGATGIVHKVFDIEGQPFAIKILKTEFAKGERLRRFRNELNFCRTVRHPNIIHAVDWGVSERNGEQVPFLVMPYFPTTLAQIMAQGIPPTEVLRWFGKILDGLAEAHRLGVHHRDLKPKNILCDSAKEELVISDFGIAHFAEPLLHTFVNSSTGDRLANFEYAAPEQRRSGPVGERADVWALGLILNEMFTGMLAIGKGHRSIASVVESYAYLDSLVEQMLQQAPEARPSVADLRESIRVNSSNVAGSVSPMPEQSTVTESPVPRPSLPATSGGVNDLALKQQGRENGLVVWVENTGIDPIEQCGLILRNLSEWAPLHREFRRNPFEPRTLMLPRAILSGDTSDGFSLGFLSGSDKATLEIQPNRAGERPITVREGLWCAELVLRAGNEERAEQRFFEWRFGNNPRFVPDPRLTGAVAEPAQGSLTIDPVARVKKHKDLVIPRLESVIEHGHAGIYCIPRETVNTSIEVLQRFATDHRLAFSEAMRNHFPEPLQNGISLANIGRGNSKDTRSTERITLYRDGFVAFDGLLDKDLDEPNTLHPYWLSYQILRHMQLAKALLLPLKAVAVTMITELNHIEQYRMIFARAEFGSSARSYSPYGGPHEPIVRTLQLEDIPDHDGPGRNTVTATISDVMDEVSRIFSLPETPEGVWEVDGKLAYVKGYENRR
jgi:serine/threonine protein kinase